MEYFKEKNLKNEVFNLINHVRLYKQAIILVELVGSRGQRTIECYDKITTRSMLRWKIDFPLSKNLKQRLKENGIYLKNG